ncbi:peptidoglycan DD-metalloendopeptidase family protein [Nocardioides sp. zg-1308]|uniref:Peptidoglycan DD-metalloendopeptidase family protein n=1 Tax=Nocardioides renjunii TaxID=3095075 RepID=A0ABU5K5Q8_9ACTN|nr:MULTISPECIES: M23 family metallopeptidase [unclassified Nocardioides]MDZ5660299.1 peptidoglycan DD-metalloendopeptidase family protein [Nocardioides sp. S-58]NPD03410.1 peptidoglycan DD-metalloendopeptidase family protein [Nocardioides sp. zg-1308]
MAAALVAVMALGVSAAHADDLKDKKNKVERELRGAHQDLDESSSDLRRATARLDAAQTQLADAKTRLATARGKVEVAQERDAEMQAALATAEAELATAEAALVQGRDDREVQRQQVASTVADMYSEGDPELIAFSSLIDAESTEELTRRDGVRDVIVGQEARAYDELKAAEVLLEVREEQVSAARDDVAAKRAEAAEHLALMRELEAEQQAAKDSVVSLVLERRDARVGAREARAQDLAKLRELEREQSRIEEMLRKRALAALRRQRAAQARSQAAATPGAPSGGVLAYPVDGYVTSPFGYRTHPIYHYWGLHDGVDFAGGCGTPLRAAASGKVVSSYISDVYGHRLVVDHGALAGRGVASIYNHATSYTVGVGDQVERGQVIGYEGSTGWSTGCHLHFTVMVNGQAVDPMNWL